MILLILSILAFTSVFVLFKLFGKFKIDNLQAIVINYIVAAFISFFVAKDANDLNAVLNREWITAAAYLGALFIISFLIFAYSTQKAGVAITAVASKMSVLIPVLFGIYFYANETLNIYVVIGLVLSILSFYLIFKKKESAEIKWKLFLLPASLFLLNGITDSLMKFIRQIHLPVENTPLNEEIIFVGVLFSTSFLIGSIVLFIRQIYTRKQFELKTIIGGIILGALNFASALLLFKAMGNYSSAFFFPVFNIGVVGLSALIGQFVFKEKLSTINWVGLLTATISIAILTAV